MSRVALATNDLSGLYNFRRELVIELLERGNEVYIISPTSFRKDYFEGLGAHLVPVEIDGHGTNPVKEFGLLKVYRKVLKQVKPDMVFTYTVKPNIYAGMVCASLNIPYIENITGLGSAVENPGMMQKVMVRLYKFALRKCNTVFFQNRSNMDFMLQKGIVKEENTDLLPGSGVNLTHYEVLPYPGGEHTEFAFISRIMKEKGIDEYLESAKIIKEKYPDTVFHVCGACDEKYRSVIQQAHDQGLINYHGSVDDVREIHKVSSCTIMPSYYPEGMSNVLLESCACGRPVITTDRPGCGEAVDDGINGFIVKQKDSRDLVDKIQKFMNLSPEKRKQMGLAGRGKVEREFDRNIVVRKYMERLEQI